MENHEQQNENEEIKMDKKSKILIWSMVVLIIASIGASYYRYMIKKDYVIEAQVDCDPYEETCFVWECDPNSTEEGEACTGDPESDIWYYKIARRNAMNIPLCDPNVDENCEPFVCGDGENDCEQILCDEETKNDQGVECNDPVKYSEENPDDETACLEGEDSENEEGVSIDDSALEVGAEVDHSGCGGENLDVEFGDESIESGLGDEIENSQE